MVDAGDADEAKGMIFPGELVVVPEAQTDLDGNGDAEAATGIARREAKLQVPAWLESTIQLADARLVSSSNAASTYGASAAR